MVPSGTDLRHKALLYRSRAGLVADAVPLLREGLRQGEHVLVVSSPEHMTAMRGALTEDEACGITFEDSAGRYGVAARALSGFQRMLADHARAGRRVRVLAEQPLTAVPRAQVDELCRVDAAFNAVSCARGATVVCAYDERTTPRRVADMVLRSHPTVVSRGRCRPSPHYTEPRALLARQYRGPPLPEPPDDAAALLCPRDIADAREFVAAAAGHHGLTDPALDRFVAAVNEIVTNAMVHAVLDSVLVWGAGSEVVCDVRDYGFGLPDPLAGYRHPESTWVSGRGWWLARQLVDLVEVRSGLDGSTFRLHMSLPAGGADAPI